LSYRLVSQKGGQSRRAARNCQTALKQSVALWPPKPREFLSTALTFTSRAAFGM